MGRKEELNTLSERIFKQQAKNLVLLAGMGGIGKTSTCVQWLNHTAMQQFDHVAWISCKAGIEDGLTQSGLYKKLKCEPTQRT